MFNLPLRLIINNTKKLSGQSITSLYAHEAEYFCVKIIHLCHSGDVSSSSVFKDGERSL